MMIAVAVTLGVCLGIVTAWAWSDVRRQERRRQVQRAWYSANVAADKIPRHLR